MVPIALNNQNWKKNKIVEKSQNTDNLLSIKSPLRSNLLTLVIE